MPAMELVRAGRWAFRPMGRHFPLLVDGGAALSAFLHGPGHLPRATRVTLSVLVRKPAGFSLRPIGHSSAYASAPLGALTGIRRMSTNRSSNNGRWHDDPRMFLLQMYLYLNGLVSRNHSATTMHVERVRTEIMGDVYKFFQDTTWRWIGILTASLSGTMTLSYILFEKRASMNEEHMEKRLDVQDREIKLLKVQLGLQMAGKTTNLDDCFSTSHADHVDIGSLIMINDSACKVDHVSSESDDMVRFVCKDFFSGRRLEIVIPCDYMLKMPRVTSEKCLVLSCSPESRFITVRSEVTNVKKDIKAEPDLIAKLQNMKSSRAFVTVASCIGRDIVTSAWDEPAQSWLGIFKRS